MVCRSARLVGFRRLWLVVAAGLVFAAGPGAAAPLWLADEGARIGLDPATDSGVFAWGSGSSAIESRLWWWLQVEDGPVRSLDEWMLEVDRHGDDRVDLEVELDDPEVEFELELGVESGEDEGWGMALLQEFEVENEGGQPLELRLLLLADFAGDAPHPIGFQSGADPWPEVVEWIGATRLETSFSRAPDQLHIGSPTLLLSDFGVGSDDSDLDKDSGSVEPPGWAAEWWFELQPFDEIEFAVQTRSVPEPSVSLLFVSGLAVVAVGRRSVRSVRGGAPLQG